MSEPFDPVPSSRTEPITKPDRRQGAIDLLGIIGYGTLAAFERLAHDAGRAPTLPDKVHLAEMAALQVAHFERVRSRLATLETDVMVAMRPFHAAFDAYHEHTVAKDWLEGLIWAYVGNGFAADFYREVATYVDPDTRELVDEVLADQTDTDFVIAKVRAGIAADPKVAGRLALWGRRLMGEALSQAQRVAAERDALTSLLTGTVDRPGLDMAEIGRTFTRLVENHTQRMSRLGLQA